MSSALTGKVGQKERAEEGIEEDSQISNRFSTLGRGRTGQPGDALGGAFTFSIPHNNPNVAAQGWDVPGEEQVRSWIPLQTVDVLVVFTNQF